MRKTFELTEHERTALELAEDGLGNREIAQQMGISSDSARDAVNRAREKQRGLAVQLQTSAAGQSTIIPKRQAGSQSGARPNATPPAEPPPSAFRTSLLDPTDAAANADFLEESAFWDGIGVGDDDAVHDGEEEEAA